MSYVLQQNADLGHKTYSSCDSYSLDSPQAKSFLQSNLAL